MTNFALLWKARIIEKYRLEYEQEKINSMLNSNVDIPKNKLINKWSHYGCNTRKRLIEKFRNFYPEGSSVSNFFAYLTTDQTFPNFLMKSVIGFIGGIVFTYLCFMFFVFQLSISLMHATIMSSVIGVLLTLGLAFSYRVRCLTFLLIPQFFSRVGRYTLTCYALVLILTGPATNTLKNSEVLSESMACNQEQIKASVKHITDSIKNPFNAMKDWVKVMTEGIKGVAKKLKSFLVATHRMVISIANILESSFPWLNSVTNKCNAKLGTPYQHCSRILYKPDTDGKRQLHSKSPWSSASNYLADVSCYTLKRHKRICDIADYTRTTVVATMKRKFQIFANRVQSLLSVKIHVHHSYSFSSNASRSASQVAAGIVTEIRNRADPLLTWLSWSSCVTSLFLLLIIFRAKNYQHMYETGSRFDNRYITKELRNLDFERLKEGKETILPLNRREKAKYITTTSFRLLASEKVYLTRSVVHMVITTFKLLIHMAADYSLYWVLMTLRYNWRFQTPLQPGPANAGVHVTGTGPVADILRSVLKYLTLPLSTPPSSSVSCLPNPYPPDLYRYTQIGVLIFLLWFFALFEPYGLRLSHVIMGHYRPERAKARALWLYNHILRSRVGFVKFARRKLHKDYKYSKKDEFTFVQWLDSHLPFLCCFIGISCWWLRYLLGTLPKDPNCLLCGTMEVLNKPDSKLFRCDTPHCPGIYCNHCYNDLGLLCTICLSPVDYGDLSDVSLEKGSSEDSSSDCLDCDGQMDSEDEVFAKQIQFLLDKREDVRDINKFSSHKDSENKYQEDDLFNLQCKTETTFTPIIFRRKANIVRYAKYYNYSHNDVVIMEAKTPFYTNIERKISNTKTCYPKELDYDIKTTSTNRFSKLLNIWGILFNYSNENKDVSKLKQLHVGFKDNYKYKRKDKMRVRNIPGYKRRQVAVDYLRNKLSKMRRRELNVSNVRSRIRVSSKITSVKTKDLFRGMITQFKPRYKTWKHIQSLLPDSKYYNIKFKMNSFKISKFVQRNKYVKKLRRNYKSVFRCKSERLPQNKRIFASKASTCSSSDRNFIEPQNVANYCKNLCFIKSSKTADGNSKKSLSNKKSNKTPQKAPDNNDVPKKNSPVENNEAGKGDKNDEDKLDNKSTCYCMKHIRRLCFCRHKNFSLTPCSLFKRIFKKNGSSQCSSTTNHKRRKKIKSGSVSDPNNQGRLIKEKDDETARIYRLSTYIGQQEWMKGQFSKSSHIGLRKRKLFPTTSTQSLHKLKLHSGSKVIDVNLSNTRIKKSKNKENSKKNTDNGLKFREKAYGNNDNVKKNMSFEDKKRLNQRNLLTHKWFDNYYSLLPNISSLSLKTIMKANKTVNSVSDYGMSRSLRYYCSIGNTEFDQIACPDAFKVKATNEIYKKEDTARRSLKTESECSPFHSCCCSVEDLQNNKAFNNFKRFPNSQRGTSSINFNFKTEFELLSKPVRSIKIKSIKHAMSDRFLHLNPYLLYLLTRTIQPGYESTTQSDLLAKRTVQWDLYLRLRNPFPLVKDFYSTMLDNKVKKTNGKPKGIRDGKSKAVTVQPRRKSATCQFEGDASEQKEKEISTQNAEISNIVPESQNKTETPIQTDCKEILKPPEYTITSISNRSVIESSMNPRRRYAINTQSTLINRSISIFDEQDLLEGLPKKLSNRESAKLIETINRGVETSETLLLNGNDRPNTASLPYSNTVGPSNLFQTVFRPSEHGSYLEDYHERVPKKLHKQLELSTPTPTYTPRKTQIGLKRDSRTKPYIFRPAHNEDNSPEDPTLPSRPKTKPLPQCSPLKLESSQKESCKSTDQGVPVQPKVSCKTDTREQSSVECSTETNTTQDTEAISKMLENFEKSSGMDDLNQDENNYKTNVMSPNCVFRLPLLKPVEPCLIPKLESCPSVSKLDCDKPDKGRKSKHEKQQCSRGRRGNQKLTGRLESQGRKHERCQSQDRQDCLESCPVREPEMDQEKLEYLAKQERIQRQEALKRRENQRRRELREEQLKKEKLKAKMAKRALERCDSNVIGCECDGGKRPLSKSTSTNVFTDSETKTQNKKKHCKSKHKSKSAICQCPPSANIKLPRMKYKSPCHSLKSDTVFPSDDDSVETIPSCQKVKGRRTTKTIPKPIPTPFPKTTCRNFSMSKSDTWTVHSESDVGDALYHEAPHREQSTNTLTSERKQKSKYCIPVMKDCCGCSEKQTPSSQSSPITCSKSSCCTCPSDRKNTTKHKSKTRDKTPQRGMQDSDVSQTSVYRTSQQNLVKFCTRATDTQKSFITSQSKQNLQECTEYPGKPVNKCLNKSKHVQCRTSKRRTIYRPSQVPTLPSAQRPSSVARRSDRSICPPYPDLIGLRGSALSRLTEYPSSGDISGEPVVADRGCGKQYRKFKAQGTDSPVDHCAAIKRKFYMTPPECNEDNDCNMCMQKASQGTRETGSGETMGCDVEEESCDEVEPEFKKPCEANKSPIKLCPSKTSVKDRVACSNCQCHKRRKCFEVCQIPTQSMQHWSTQIETEEIKGYLRSLCRNCQCDKEPHKSQQQADNCASKNDINTLRGYLQTTWRNCQCGKVKTNEETSTSGPGQPGQLIQSQSTTVGSVDIKTSLLSVCKNCQCIKKKIFLGGKAALRLKASSNPVDGQPILNSLDPGRLKDFAGSTCFPIAPTQQKTITLQTSYDTFPENLNAKAEPDISNAKSSTEAASLVEEIVKNQEEENLHALDKTDRYNSIPSFDEPQIRELPSPVAPPRSISSALKTVRETRKERNEETATDFTPVKDSRMVNKRMSAFTKKKSSYSNSQQAIFVPSVDTCISLEHLIRDRSQTCQKRKCCATNKRFSPLRRRSKHVSDQSQIFPEKLSCGIEKLDSSPDTWDNPCKKQTEFETLPKGCVPYRTLNEDQGVCVPSPCASQQAKPSCLDSEAVPEKLPKQCDKRVTVSSKIKTIESSCSPPKPRRCDDHPVQICPPTIKYKTRIIEAKPKLTQDCGCSTTLLPPPPPPVPSCADYDSEDKNENMDNVISTHKCKKPLDSSCTKQKSVLKPAEKLPPGIKSRPSCNIRPSKQKDSSEMTEKKCKAEVKKYRRRSSHDERGSILKPSLSDNRSSKARLRSSSMESFRSKPKSLSSDNITRIRHKSAPCNYPQFEEDESCLVPPEKVPPYKKKDSNDCLKQPPRKQKNERNQRKDICKPAVKEKPETCDVAVEIRCPICTCATQCHDTSCYRSTEVKSRSFKKSDKEEKFLKRYEALDNEALFSDFTSDENNAIIPTRTVCSRVTVEYCDEPPKPAKICKVCYKLALKDKQVTKEKSSPVEKPPPKEPKVKKANQGTTTEKTRFKDVSTRTKGFFPFEKKKVNVKTPAKKTKGSKTCEKSMCTEGRLVKFKSRTQVIPCCHDVMSPSRYLMESQRQYNEIISSKITKCLCPALVNHQKYSGFCTSKIKQNSLRGHKVKRPDYYLWKRQKSPRMSDDRTRSDDSTKPAIRLMKGLRRYRIRNEAKLNATRKQRCQRRGDGSPRYKILTKSQQNLFQPYYPVEDKINLAGQCNSVSSF